MKLIGFILAFVLCASPAFAQTPLWSGYLDTARAADWEGMIYTPPSTAGWTQCGATISVAGATSTTIQNAINACDTTGTTPTTGKYIKLGPGTFGLTTGLVVSNKSNFLIRGSGADQTEVQFSSGIGCSPLGTVGICLSSGNLGAFYPNASHGTFTNGVSGFVQGSTSITVQSVAGIQAGDGILVRQANEDNSGSYAPNMICGSPATDACGWDIGAGNIAQSKGRTTIQPNVVTAVDSGTNTLTLLYPLYYSRWSNSLSPDVWFYTFSRNEAAWIHDVAVEDMKITFTWADWQSGGPLSYGIVGGVRVNGFWVKGVTVNGCNTGCLGVHESTRVSWFNNYIYNSHGATNHSQSSMYGFYADSTTGLSIYNNIVQQIQAPFLYNYGVNGSVIAYNFILNEVVADCQDPISQSNCPSPTPFVFNKMFHAIWPMHGVDITNVLMEGNDGAGVILELNHGSGCCTTYVRNFFDGRDINNGTLTDRFTNPLHLQGYSGRFASALGNVMGTAGWHLNYQSTPSANVGNNGERAIYKLGLNNEGGGFTDNTVVTSLFRWGNYDTVTGNVRWCGNSGNTNWVSVCGSTTEVPSGQAVPSLEQVPVSFAFRTRPSFFGAAVPWPPIGPEVTSGNVSGWDGHVNKIPARVCYESINGPADGLGTILTFNADTCYGGAAAQINSKFKGLSGSHKFSGSVRAN